MSIPMTSSFRILAAALAAAVIASQASAQDVLVRAAKLVVSPDLVLENGELLVRSGKVAYVGSEIPAEARQRAMKREWPTATIAPGAVVAFGWLGQEEALGERATAFTPELRAADGFDGTTDAVRKLPAEGVTAYGLAPSSRNVVAGIGALVKPAGEFARVPADDLFLHLSVVKQARDQERWPTSIMGAADLLRTTFKAAANPVSGDTRLRPFREAMQGQRQVFVHANTLNELTVALDACMQAGIAPVVVGAGDAAKCIDQLKAARARVVLGAASPDAKVAQLELPAELEAAGIPFAIVGEPSTLRWSAALAVRHGASRRAALAALTRVPAEMLGMQERIGSLRAGCDADFAVWSGDPIELTAELLAVYVDGEERHVRDAAQAAKEKN